MNSFSLPVPSYSPEAEAVRAEVRAFLDTRLTTVPPLLRARSWSGFDADFSRDVGARGWIGMTWPKIYGGHERSAIERYTVVEEMLAAGAPVAAHWFADRQTGPLLLKFGTETQKQAMLPRMAKGELFACIGMSEPDSGSDLAAVRTRAEPVADGYRINGAKLWTTYGHKAHVMVLLARTSGAPGDRQNGLSQILVDMTTPGITINPVIDLCGVHHFNEIVFEDVVVPADAIIGQEGHGWTQVMSELAYERSGPERFLSSMALFVALIDYLRHTGGKHGAAAIGRLTAHLAILRQMSLGVAAMLESGKDPAVHASIVKDLGAVFEQEIPAVAHMLIDADPADPATEDFRAILAYVMLNAPSFSLRGGTREILRGIIARGLGLR